MLPYPIPPHRERRVCKGLVHVSLSSEIMRSLDQTPPRLVPCGTTKHTALSPLCKVRSSGVRVYMGLIGGRKVKLPRWW